MADDDNTTDGDRDAEGDGQPRKRMKDFGEELKAAVRSKLDELGVQADADGNPDAGGTSSDTLKTGAHVVSGLVGQVVGALQQAAKAAVDVAGSTVAANNDEAEPDEPDHPDDPNVIDLAKERDKRGSRTASGLEQRLTGTLKSAFVEYMREHAEIETDDDGRQAASFDNDFVKQHGGRLAGTIFQAFAGALLPPDGAGEADDDDDGEATAEAGDGGDLEVKMNLDLAGLFSQLLETSMKAAPRKEEQAAPSAADDDGSGDAGPDDSEV